MPTVLGFLIVGVYRQSVICSALSVVVSVSMLGSAALEAKSINQLQSDDWEIIDEQRMMWTVVDWYAAL